MFNQSSNIFKYNHRTYSLFISLSIGADKDYEVALDSPGVDEFVYENSLNELTLRGHILYTDRYSHIDKFLDKHISYCNVWFYEHKIKCDDNMTVRNDDPKCAFIHTFVVAGIRVVSRAESIIKYQIDLVSNNWFKCISNIWYSNYGQEPKQVLDILKDCFKYNDLRINDSFDKIRSHVSLNYITNSNDNLFSVSKYLLHKMYYYPDKDDSLKFFLYNETDDMYQLLDLTDKETFTGVYSTILSFFKTNCEAIVQQESTNIGMVQNGIGKTKTYQTFFDYNMYSYSYDQNEFTNDKIEADETVNYANKNLDDGEYQAKYYKMFKTDRTFVNEGTYWNNSQNIYNNMIDAFNKSNSIVLNITGELLRKPGSILQIAIDRSMKDLTSESPEELKKLKTKYKTFEGTWFVSKVQHVICPNASSFRQQVVLFRNFNPIIENS